MLRFGKIIDHYEICRDYQQNSTGNAVSSGTASVRLTSKVISVFGDWKAGRAYPAFRQAALPAGIRGIGLPFHTRRNWQSYLPHAIRSDWSENFGQLASRAACIFVL